MILFNLVFPVENTTGWSDLISGHMVTAAFNMYNVAWVGWIVGILYCVYQIMLYIKTRSPMLGFITGILFVSLYITSDYVVIASRNIIIATLVVQLGLIIYAAFWK
jgi:hypothetical protein